MASQLKTVYREDVAERAEHISYHVQYNQLLDLESVCFLLVLNSVTSPTERNDAKLVRSAEHTDFNPPNRTNLNQGHSDCISSSKSRCKEFWKASGSGGLVGSLLPVYWVSFACVLGPF